jgi:autotransporter-associated beta strand protein
MTSAVWKKLPVSGDFDIGSNWRGGMVPFGGTADFGQSIQTNLTFSTKTSVAGLVFKIGAPEYNFQVTNIVDLTGQGISTNGDKVSFNIPNSIQSSGELNFDNASTASHANITCGFLDFFNSSNAGYAHINMPTGIGGHFVFHDSASAAHAVITLAGGLMDFTGTSTAGKAHITIDNEQLRFLDRSTAGHATITGIGNGFFANVLFENNSTAGKARLIAKSGSTIDFSYSLGPNGDGHVSAGSIAGAGTYNLGGDDLIVGANNRSTTVSGAINDGGLAGGTQSSLTKIGTGTLKLSGANNGYAGGTLLERGTLDVAALFATGPGGIGFGPGSAMLRVENAALSAHQFSNVIAYFHAGDVIDLPGLKFVTGAKAAYNSGTFVLKVKSGGITDALIASTPGPGKFKALTDGHGGTEVIREPVAKAMAHSALADDVLRLGNPVDVGQSSSGNTLGHEIAGGASDNSLTVHLGGQDGHWLHDWVL